MRKDQLKRCVLSGFLCLSILFGTSASFANNVTIGRYLSVAEKPQGAQTQLLQQQIQIKFPQNILTIKQAVQFILQFSGYHLADDQVMNKPALAMLNQLLPEVDRSFGPMTLDQGLTTLSGETFYLLVDPVHRLIAYKIKIPYQLLYVKHTISKNITGSKNEYKQTHRTIK
ncbi:MAG: hypothetical protein KIT27_00485 [Legionellales bacterium]|nr:hypothetical protein [Legionellales bacterium]